jgi:hypothetical protein
VLPEEGDVAVDPPIKLDKMGSNPNVCRENINKVRENILKGTKSNWCPLLSSKVGCNDKNIYILIFIL